MRRPVAILTDFGTADAYVGVMKGVLLARCPDARLFDLTHQIPPQDVLAGALQLRAAVPYCPADTLFLAVVDPGVGTTRRPLCLRAGRALFVGPDNGLLWPAAAAQEPVEAFHLDRPEQWLPRPGATFHGRDIFAPVAALLALGHPPEAVGSPVPDPIRLEVPTGVRGPDGVVGEVLYIDHFGNAVTSLGPDDLGAPPPLSRVFTVGDIGIPGPSPAYASVPEGHALVILGSQGLYEVAVNCGHAASALGLTRGTRIVASGTD